MTTICYLSLKSICRLFLLTVTSSIPLLLISEVIYAQEKHERPTIGLVLSGGGAHGIAHLGVLKVMEEAGLRPDYITGVSIGSVIGGMYSIGYTSDSLYNLMKKINWENTFTNKIPENKIIYLEKDHFYNSIVSVPLSARKIKLPAGLINGQQIENALNFYSWPAADIHDFTKLPIPFSCLGTNLLTGKKVELKSGYLPDAIRASIAVPTIFTPVKIDSSLLIDGGVVSNFPVFEVRNMGADIIIGSFVGFHINKDNELQSMSGIVRQLTTLSGYDDFNEQKTLADFFIESNLKDFSASAFSNIDSIYERGYKAALPFKDKFKKLADSLNFFEHQKPLDNIFDKQYYSFNKIEVTGNKTYSDFQILGILEIEPELKIDKYLLADKIDLLYGNEWFDKVKYRVIPRNDSLILEIDCIEKPPAILYGAVHYDNYLLAGLVVDISLKNLITRRSLIDLKSYISQYYRFKLYCLQFIDKNQKFGISTDFYADNSLIPNLEINGQTGNAVSRNFIPGLSINRRLGLNNMMSISSKYENTNLLLRYVSESDLKSLTYNYLSSAFEYRLNTLNTKHYPDKGMIFNMSASTSKLMSAIIRTDSSEAAYKINNQSGLSFERFYSVNLHLKQYLSLSDKFTIGIGGDLLFISKTDSVSSSNNFSLLGGFESVNKRSIAMTGFHSNEIPVKKLAGISTDLDIELFKDLHLNLMADFFIIQEAKRENGFSFLNGYGAGLGYMSIIGPMKIGIMTGNYSQEKFFNKTKGYISIGYKF